MYIVLAQAEYDQVGFFIKDWKFNGCIAIVIRDSIQINYSKENMYSKNPPKTKGASKPINEPCMPASNTDVYNKSLCQLVDFEVDMGAVCYAPTPCPVEKEEKGSTMTETLTNQVHDDLRNRLRNAKYNKTDANAVTFNIIDMPAPKTVNEFKARITAGQFSFGKYDATPDKEISWLYDSLRWRDPAKPADEAGYSAANKALDEAYTNAKSALLVKLASNDFEAALKVVTDFIAA